jgi:hypothetical protein
VINPVTKPVENTISPVIDPIVKPVQKSVDPVVEPVKETVDAVVGPVENTDKLDPVAGGPVQRTELPLGDPPVGSSPVSPTPQPTDQFTGPTRQTAQPVAAPAASDPMLRAERSPVAGSAIEAGSLQAGREPLVTRLEGNTPAQSAARVSTSSPLNEVAAPAESEQASLTATMGGGRLAIPFFSDGERSSISDFATASTGHNASSQMPQPLPYSGTLPVLPAPSSSSASGGSSSFSGVGRNLDGALALILILILGGKFVWYARDFVKPDSAFQLLIKQPG